MTGVQTCALPILVLAWYILTELGSILENAVRLGARVPKWLTKFLAAFEHLVDDAADKVIDVSDTATTDGLEAYVGVAEDQQYE